MGGSIAEHWGGFWILILSGSASRRIRLPQTLLLVEGGTPLRALGAVPGSAVLIEKGMKMIAKIMPSSEVSAGDQNKSSAAAASIAGRGGAP